MVKIFLGKFLLLNTILKILISTNGGGRGWGQPQVEGSNAPGGVDSMVCKRISILYLSSSVSLRLFH